MIAALLHPHIFSQCTYVSGFSLAEGKSTALAPAIPKPAHGAWFHDSAYKTCVVRATDYAADGLPSFARNDYSRRQAFNADNSMYLIYSHDGSWHVYSTGTLTHIKELPALGGDAEPQWNPADPDKLFFVPTNGGNAIKELTVSTGAVRVAADFSGKLPWTGAAHIWTKSEGSPSADGRYWGLMAEDNNFNILGIFTYDMQTGGVIATYATNNNPDNVTMSPTGQFIVINWDDGMYAFARDFKSNFRLSTTGEHTDIALGADGHDIFVSVDYNANDGSVYMYDLQAQQRTDLFATYLNSTATALHFSGKAFSKPGWALVSTYADYGGSVQWLHRKVFAVELKANPRIYCLAHHHVSKYSDDYWDEPHATVNRDFTRILFNSNWDAGTINVDAYMIYLTPGLIPDLPAQNVKKEPVSPVNRQSISTIRTSGNQIRITMAQPVPGNYHLSLLSLNGKEVWSKKLVAGKGFTQTFACNCPPGQGVYLLRCVQNGIASSEKIVTYK